MSICKPSEQYLAKLRERYRHAHKKERGQMLNEFVATTGYHRKHAITVLRGTRGHRQSKSPRPRLRRRIYLAEDKRASCGSQNSLPTLARSVCVPRWMSN